MNGSDEEDLTPVHKAFALELARLESLWIVNLESVEAGIQIDLNWTNCKAHHNRSVPVFSAVQLIFGQVPIKPFGVRTVVDPRPIVSDLG
ncbi:hypothetical protein PG990_011078 [Apiospora arundinis]